VENTRADARAALKTVLSEAKAFQDKFYELPGNLDFGNNVPATSAEKELVEYLLTTSSICTGLLAFGSDEAIDSMGPGELINHLIEMGLVADLFSNSKTIQNGLYESMRAAENMGHDPGFSDELNHWDSNDREIEWSLNRAMVEFESLVEETKDMLTRLWGPEVVSEHQIRLRNRVDFLFTNLEIALSHTQTNAIYDDYVEDEIEAHLEKMESK